MDRWLRFLRLGTLLFGAVVLDFVVIAPVELPVAILYTVPMVAAAQWHVPRTAGTCVVVSLVLYLGVAILEQSGLVILLPRFVVMIFVGYLVVRQAAHLDHARRARAEAEEAQRQLLRFTSMVAHDLRGPLTSILGYVQLLPRVAPLPEYGSAVIGRAQHEAHRMNRLIEDLSDASRIGAGAFTVTTTTTDLVALAREVVQLEQAENSRHTFVLVAPEGLVGVWDPDRLTQVLQNLIGNAVKYSPSGGRIEIRLWRDDGQACVSVSDQGIGIRRGDLPRLFEPFARLHGEQGTKGAGLGLYIARGIIEAHGGAIWASSPGPGRGSTFTFRLPLRV